MYVCMYIYIYMYVCIYIYIYIERERERERETDIYNAYILVGGQVLYRGRCDEARGSVGGQAPSQERRRKAPKGETISL